MSTTNFPANEHFYTGGTHITAQGDIHYHGSEAEDVDELLKNVAPSALYNTAEVQDPAKCHPGTREAILRRLFGTLDRRLTDPDKPFAWLHGAAGAGKSAIARTLCEQLHAEGQLLASFFFFHASSERNSAARLISTLTFQLRAIIPQLRPQIRQYIRDNPLIFTQSLDTQAHELLINPIRQLHKQGRLPKLPQTATVINSSRSDQFYIAQDLLYERILRSFMKHPSPTPRFLMFTNMEFLFSKARVTPELISAIKSVDFVASDALMQGLQPLSTNGEDS